MKPIASEHANASSRQHAIPGKEFPIGSAPINAPVPPSLGLLLSDGHWAE
eukprot:CAMPEP_0179174266 /NCGR_PEP_ID=MMETSP0796-20121207/86034_1 /TAXON_ID=73915 /ORGANISM="Pyrodinium bahamense, Strain pbaha01" /LENGTH=49 /DNA_ID=CAMNT_0020877557 /DNA_START=11 /DNA_END=160 /DNA_ORIENTATION=+